MAAQMNEFMGTDNEQNQTAVDPNTLTKKQLIEELSQCKADL